MASGGQRSGKGSQQRGNTPRNNQAQNKQVKSIVKKVGLTKDQQDELHSIVTHQGMSYEEMMEEAINIKESHKGEKPWKKK